MTTYSTVKELHKMNKSCLIDMIIRLQSDQKKQTGRKATGRKEQVLQCLRDGINTIDKIAETLGITNKNVSSQLTYLRKEGHMIYSIRLNNVTTLKLEELT